MAVSITYKGEAYDQGSIPGGTPVTTASFTPTNNSLLVAAHIGQMVSDTEADISGRMSISGGGLTWTRQVFRNSVSGGGAWDTCISIFTAPVATGASMTVTATINTSSPSARDQYRNMLQVFEVLDSARTFGTTAEGNGSGGSNQSITLSANTTTSSLVVASIACDDAAGAATPGSSWTEIREGSVGGYGMQTQYRLNASNTNVDWASVTASFGWIAGAIEIKGLALERMMTIIHY